MVICVGCLRRLKIHNVANNTSGVFAPAFVWQAVESASQGKQYTPT